MDRPLGTRCDASILIFTDTKVSDGAFFMLSVYREFVKGSIFFRKQQNTKSYKLFLNNRNELWN